MERERNTWEETLKELVAELKAAEHIYGTLIQSDRYPTWQAYFKKRHFQGQSFAKILSDEYYTVIQRKLAQPLATDSPIFESLETQLLEGNPSNREITVLILNKEEELVLQYQNILAFSGMPKTTYALLQSQAEDLNSNIQNLRMDYNTKYKTGPLKTS